MDGGRVTTVAKECLEDSMTSENDTSKKIAGMPSMSVISVQVFSLEVLTCNFYLNCAKN